MTNDASAIREYHERTKLYPDAPVARRIDAALVPKQYKRYVNLPSVSLLPPGRSQLTLFDILNSPGDRVQPPKLADLSAVLHYAAGIVRRANLGGRKLAFRGASCTGALYHIELYVVCGELQGELSAGVYHYDVLSESLRPLRAGDYRRALASACCDDAIVTRAASVVLSSTFWRNAWRYEERTYRHVFWDAGTLLTNLLAEAEAHNLRPVLYSAFVDAHLNALLDIDPRREAAVAVVSLGADVPAAGTNRAAIAPLGLETEPLSRAEIEYPLIWQTHAATSLSDCDAVLAWRQQASSPAAAFATMPRHLDALTLEESIEARRSARRFSQSPLSHESFDAVLDAIRGSHRSDQPLASALCRPLLIVNRVEGIGPGAYRFDEHGELSLIAAGHFEGEATHLALDQAAAGSAAVNLYFVANLDEVTGAMGERGYRAVQLEAGIRTGQVYLASAALGLKASGLTFYDDEAASFFGLDPAGTAILMLVVFGA